MDERTALRDLQRCPGVGPLMARDLVALGVASVEDLRAQDPEQLYADLCALQRCAVDRCVLYVFRCAVYFAGTPEPEPELLQWWNWKDR